MRKQKERQLKEQEHFDKYVSDFGESWWGHVTAAGIKRLQRKASIFAEYASQFKSPYVLEVGCGTGSLTQLVLDEVDSMKLKGCDISPKSVQKATEKLSRYHNAHFELADVCSLPYPPDTFDAVFGNSILHHLPLAPSLKECFRVLKPGGFILFFEPNMMNPQIALEKNVRFIGKLSQASEDETAFFRWSLANKIHGHNFQDIVVRPFDFLHPLAPSFLISSIDYVGRLLEKVPLVREISGSLLIRAIKPK